MSAACLRVMLESYIADKLKEARRCKRIAEKACSEHAKDYWDGVVSTLKKLRTNTKRWYKPHGAPKQPTPKRAERCEARRMKSCRWITQLAGETWQKCGRKAVTTKHGKKMCRQCSES